MAPFCAELTMAMNCVASLVLCDEVTAKLKGTDSIDRLTKTTQALFEGTKNATKPVNVEEWHKRREETCSWTVRLPSHAAIH